MNEYIPSGLTIHEHPQSDALQQAMRRLYEAGQRIDWAKTLPECGPQAAAAVAEYLDAVVSNRIDRVEYTFKDGHMELYEFDPQNYVFFEHLSEMLRHPESHKEDIIGVTKAWEVLFERGMRFEKMQGSDPKIAKTFMNTFCMAARHIASKADIVIGKPHSVPSQRPKYGLIP